MKLWTLSTSSGLSIGDKISIGPIKGTVSTVPDEEMLACREEGNDTKPCDIMLHISGCVKRAAAGVERMLLASGGDVKLMSASPGTPLSSSRLTLYDSGVVMIHPKFATVEMSVGQSELKSPVSRNRLGVIPASSQRTISVDETSVDMLLNVFNARHSCCSSALCIRDHFV